MLVVMYGSPLLAASTQELGTFSLQVTPSPLVLTMKPGETTTSELRIRNNGDKKENLKIEPRSFNINSDNGDVSLGDTAPSDIARWIQFSNPTFTIEPGQWITEKITLSLPSSAGFSYSFALVISRNNDTSTVKPGETALKGSLAVFTLIAVDKPGATKQLEITQFSVSQKIYEYLPASITTTIKNTGNTLVQPAGNIFIQRHATDTQPISTIPVNDGGGYILPGSVRTLTSQWSDGFPHYSTEKAQANTDPKTVLNWNWAQLSQLRIGKYVAKAVVVYNDGVRDVPLEAQATFWVFPWKIAISALALSALIVVGIATIIKKSIKLIKPHKSIRPTKHDDETDVQL